MPIVENCRLAQIAHDASTIDTTPDGARDTALDVLQLDIRCKA